MSFPYTLDASGVLLTAAEAAAARGEPPVVDEDTELKRFVLETRKQRPLRIRVDSCGLVLV